MRTHLLAPAVDNAIARYYEGISDAIEALDPAKGETGGFGPGFDLPELSPAVVDFYSASSLSAQDLGTYRGRTLTLLNLMGNPRTRTTKTLASLLIVARAVQHIWRTNERVMLLTPTSANKGTALRDAVLRAHERKLVSADRLQIAVLVPRGALHKLWRSALVDEPALRRKNPVFTFDGSDPEDVKAIGREFVSQWAPEARSQGINVWWTLELDNYRVADSVRAYFEAEACPPPPETVRVHAHAVSSAYGLLGYDLGRRVLIRKGAGAVESPWFFLIQHLDTADMVLSLRSGTFSREAIPAYRRDPATGLFEQEVDPAFPAAAEDPRESIDPTFYTHEPATAAMMNDIVSECGGDGIVVSRHECVSRYEDIRSRLGAAGVGLPADSRSLREWALVMAMTGVLNGIDRNLIPDGADVVVHGSGSYGSEDYRPVEVGRTTPIGGPDDMAEPMRRAIEA